MALKSELEENPYEPPIDADPLKSELDYRDQFESEEDYLEAIQVWPRCPKCGRRRITRCPVCKTSGDVFALGDSTFWDRRSEEERAIAEAYAPHGCCCGGHGRDEGECNCGGHGHNEGECKCGGHGRDEGECKCGGHGHDEGECKCGGHGHDEGECKCGGHGRDGGECKCGNRHDETLYNENEPTAVMDGEIFPGVPSPRRRFCSHEKTSDVFDGVSDERERVETWPETGESVPVVLCHVCSEAFTPTFPKRCEWCGYEFPDGVEVLAEEGADENGVDDFIKRRENEPNEDEEANPTRVIVTIAALIAVLLGLLLYLGNL